MQEVKKPQENGVLLTSKTFKTTLIEVGDVFGEGKPGIVLELESGKKVKIPLSKAEAQLFALGFGDEIELTVARRM